MTTDDLLASIDGLRSILISVSTGGPRIQEVEQRYIGILRSVSEELRARGISNPIAFQSLWDWHGRWSQDDLPTYASRRTFIGELFNPLIATITAGAAPAFEPTGWERIDRTVQRARDQLSAAKDEEQYQAIGLLGRETLISLGQQVWDPDHIIELLNASFLLFDNKKYSTSAFLSITAIEETGKAHVAIFRKDGPGPKPKGRDPLKNHGAKHAMAVLPTVFFDLRLVHTIGKKACERLQAEAENGDFVALREAALYVARVENEFVTPEIAIKPARSWELLLLAIATLDDALARGGILDAGRMIAIENIATKTLSGRGRGKKASQVWFGQRYRLDLGTDAVGYPVKTRS
jgi:AbiV family abortive infection protein